MYIAKVYHYLLFQLHHVRCVGGHRSIGGCERERFEYVGIDGHLSRFDCIVLLTEISIFCSTDDSTPVNAKSSKEVILTTIYWLQRTYNTYI